MIYIDTHNQTHYIPINTNTRIEIFALNLNLILFCLRFFLFVFTCSVSSFTTFSLCQLTQAPHQFRRSIPLVVVFLAPRHILNDEPGSLRHYFCLFRIIYFIPLAFFFFQLRFFSAKSFFDHVVVVVVIALASHCWWVFERHLNVFTKRVWQTRAKQIKPSTCRHRLRYRIKVNVFCARCHKRMSFLVIVVVAVVLSFRRRWADCITTYCGGHNEPQYSIVFQITKSRLRWSVCGCGCGSPSSDA